MFARGRKPQALVVLRRPLRMTGQGIHVGVSTEDILFGFGIWHSSINNCDVHSFCPNSICLLFRFAQDNACVFGSVWHLSRIHSFHLDSFRVSALESHEASVSCFECSRFRPEWIQISSAVLFILSFSTFGVKEGL